MLKAMVRKSTFGKFNSFFGGVGFQYTNPLELSNSLTGLKEWMIEDFKVDAYGNISCFINQMFSAGAWQTSPMIYVNSNITYFISPMLTQIGGSCFRSCPNLKYIHAESGIIISSSTLRANNEDCVVIISDLSFNASFYQANMKRLVARNNSVLGTTVGNDGQMNSLSTKGIHLYMNALAETNNAGGIEGDYAYAQNSRNAILHFMRNQTLPEKVTDLDYSNLTIDDGVTETTLTNKAADGWGNCGGESTNKISGDGQTKMEVIETDKHRMFGLSYINADDSYLTIDYAIYLWGSGGIRIYESGVYTGTQFPAYSTGDVFKVGRVGSQIHYYKNNVIFYTSLIIPTGADMITDISIYANGGTIHNASINDVPIVWKNLNGFSISSVVLNFTPPTAINTIDYYELWIDDGLNNGLYLHSPYKELLGSGETIDLPNTELTKFKIRAVDTYFNRAEFSNVAQIKAPNTIIGNGAVNFPTATNLANVLSIGAGNILDYIIKGNDVHCYIDAPYNVNNNAFFDLPITFYYDLGAMMRVAGQSAFRTATLQDIDFRGCTQLQQYCFFRGSTLNGKVLTFPKLTSIVHHNVFRNSGMRGIIAPELVYIGAGIHQFRGCSIHTWETPKLSVLGDTGGYDNIFGITSWTAGNEYIFPISLATRNAGGPDVDLLDITNQGGLIKYV